MPSILMGWTQVENEGVFFLHFWYIFCPFFIIFQSSSTSAALALLWKFIKNDCKQLAKNDEKPCSPCIKFSLHNGFG